MQKICLPILILILSSCAAFQLVHPKPVVRVTVSAFSDENFSPLLESNPTLNFRYSLSDDIVFVSENQQITRACKDAAIEAGYKVEFNNMDCKNCVDVYVAHRFDISNWKGSAKAYCSSVSNQNSFNSETYCSTWIPEIYINDRWIALGFYAKGQKRSIHRIATYSNGPIRSIIKVAREHCLAALSEYPSRFEDHRHDVVMKSNEDD